MATSPIYSWPEPDNTDLVKNGALAIRTLGNAIDTTMATMVPKTIVDAKGDLIAGTAADTAARLAVGNNGETLVADSSTSTGLRYQGSQAAGKNVLINGAFDIWQRGTSFTTGTLASPFFIADRWQSTRSGAASGATITRQTSGAPTGFQYYVRLQRDSGNTGTQGVNLGQCIETSMAQPFAGQTITLSFYARAGATYNSAANNVNVIIYTGTGTDQNNFSASYTGAATALSTTASVTTSWQRFSFTVTLASTVTEFEPLIITQHSGTAGATDYIDVTGVQIELGSVATAFTRAGGTIQGELAACQRYYFRTANDSAFAQFAAGVADSGTSFTAYLQLPVTMRVAPTAVEWSNLRSIDGPNDYGAPSSVTINTYLNNRNVAGFTVSDTGYTTYRPMYLQANNNAAAYLAVTAEL